MVIRITPTERARKRTGISLWTASVQVRTLQRYRKAVSVLLPFIAEVTNFAELDGAICDWIEVMWARGETLGIIGDALSGMHAFWPQCRRQLLISWKLFKTWRRLEPPQRAPPLPAQVASAFLAFCVEQHQLELGVLVGLGFHCLLRTGELLTLSLDDIWLGSSRAVVNLRVTKTSQRSGSYEAVTVSDRAVIKLLETLLFVRQAKLCPGTIWLGSHQSFRIAFRHLCKSFHLQAQGFHPYSLRRGGGTFLLQQGVALEHILLRGRWQSMKAARVYLQDGMATLADIKLSSQSLALVANYNSHFTASP